MSTDLQPELPLDFAAAQVVDPAEVADMIRLLRGQGWVRAKSFPIGWTERRIRAVASASAGKVISGQLGYRLTHEATIDEVRKASSWLRHQAKEMTRRAVEIERVYHKGS